MCGGRGRDAMGKHVLHGIADARKGYGRPHRKHGYVNRSRYIVTVNREGVGI